MDFNEDLEMTCVSFILFVFGCLSLLATNDLSVGSTETKYIKLKTKTQNNIGTFSKKLYCYFGFF